MTLFLTYELKVAVLIAVFYLLAAASRQRDMASLESYRVVINSHRLVRTAALCVDHSPDSED